MVIIHVSVLQPHRSTDGMLQCPDQGALDTQEPQLQLAPALLFPRPTSSPPGPSWGLGWANATAPEGLGLMARKWPDNPTGGLLSQGACKKHGYLGLCLEPSSEFHKGVLTLSTLDPRPEGT